MANLIAGSAKRLIKLARIIARPSLFLGLTKGVAAAIEHDAVLSHKSYQMIVDVGANRGQFALASRYWCPSARILSFEPLIEPSMQFEKVFASDSGISLYREAIGPISTQSVMHVSSRDDSSSLLPITKLQDSLFPGTKERATTEVKVTRLNDVLGKGDITAPALLKIDVQGYELQVLDGCKSLLISFDDIYIECSFVELYAGQALADEVIAWLGEQGFHLAGVYNMSYDNQGKSIQADFLFKKLIPDK